MKIARPVLLALVLVVLAGPLARSEDADRERADKLFQEKNYRDAARVYEALLKGQPAEELTRHASRRLVLCQLRLRQFDPALDAAEAYIERMQGTPWEARAHRFAGNLWLNVPHWGTRRGGEFHRATWMQGMQVRSYKHDKKRAVGHLETARDLYAAYDAEGPKAASVDWDAKEREGWHRERLECLFDLAGACARFGIYENQWFFWWGYWAERDDFLAETAGEDDFDEYYSQWQMQRKRPIGLRLGPDGNPIFTVKPKGYAPNLTDEQKILFLFDEIRGLDTTENRAPTAASYYRQAMLARARFGMDRLNGIAGVYWSNERFPLQEEMKSFQPWTMEDSQALVLAGGKIRVVDLPPQWDVFRLLNIVSGVYEASGLAAQACYAAGLHRQTRQQYLRAITTYEEVQRRWPKSGYAKHAGTQVGRIRAAQVHVNQTGVQLPGEPARLQISYRNTSEVHFVARRIDLVAFFEALRDQEFDVFNGPRDLWALQNWHAWFVQPYNDKSFARRLARTCLREEVARWSDKVVDDGTHRYAEVMLQTPLDEPGAYLVYAYLQEPPVRDEKRAGDPLLEGTSRAVVVLTDLALVEKNARPGRLYFVADARTGAPVPGATLDIVEHWSVWEGKIHKSRHYRERWQRTTDEQGLALDERPKRETGQLHVVASAGTGREARLAWTGMRYWNRYSPSHVQQGTFAYTITDRPVYRPGQTVRYKTWIRNKRQGVFQPPRAQSWQVTVYDPRGNPVHKANGQTDELGGFDGQFTLGEEPTLGVYRLDVNGARWRGGQNFRVEEYKKPEFEVKVEPATRHAKLGETLKAKIRADYYFGAPVTDAEVKYKVFREEYRHAYYAPGPWDWLYGPGYGYAWYTYDWYPWWGEMRCCRVPPYWWWGFWPGSYGRWGAPPLRELVAEGEGPIGDDGSLEVEIDTAPALRDHGDVDHRYVIQAEVRDASRRVISGEGAVKVTRQAYYAMVDSDRGWYRPGEEIVLTVRCLTPDNEPVQTEGVVSVTDVVFGGRGNKRIEQTELDRFTAETNERGELQVKFRHERSGQLRFTFEAPDEWGGIVRGHGLIWVCGEDFDGSLQRFNDLELITDKRTYEPGDTAHVLVNTKRRNSWVLFGDEVDSGNLLSWRMLHLEGRSRVVDVPVKEGSIPNFFVEATTVSDVRVHQQTKRICVPPKDGVIDVQVVTDKPDYEAGETAVVKVRALKPDGTPAEAQVTLSAFDRSVLYIQGEYTPAIAKFFHGNLRHHQASMQTNLLDQFSSYGGVSRPYQQIHPVPPGWFGIWGPIVGDWRRDGDDLIDALGDREGLEVREAVGGGAGARGMREPAAPGAPPADGAEAAGDLGVADASKSARRDGEAGAKKPAGAGQAPAFAEAEVRARFADTALWQTTLTTGGDGTAETEVEMPENLTTWKVNAWGMTRGTQVGQASTSCVTTKNLIVRLQAPRFFMEYDEVVLSANVHNYLQEKKTARVSLDVPDELLTLSSETPATVDVEVAAGGEARVDWRVHVVKEGLAAITAKALTDEESDAVRMSFPVLVHGMTKQVATTGSMRPDETPKTLTVELDVPEQRRPELTRLEVQYAPSLVGAMLDALPYCLDYPYGCTEQTVSRFLPAVLTLKTLQHMGIDLEEVKEVRGRMAEIRRIEKGEHIKIRGTYAENPVFDGEEMQKIIQKGLGRITRMQQPDGGWGWWTRDSSSPYLTSYVLYALLSAREADVEVPDQLIQRGTRYLTQWAVGEMADKHWAPTEYYAFVGYVLSLAKQRVTIKPGKDDKRAPELLERLWQGRDRLNLYGKSLLSLALANVNETQEATTTLQNILQHLERNDETQVAWLRTPTAGWWYWWNNDIETNAWALRALVKLDPKSDLAPRMVKWLLNNRRNGYYWRSTRDTTLCVAAMSEFVTASGEGAPDYTLRLELDGGQVVKEVKIDKSNFFTYDNRFVVEGVTLAGGKHTLKITKTGPGALYVNTYLSYFTKEEHITAAGHELKVKRRYFLLKRIPYEVDVEGADGQPLKEKRLRYERVPLKDGDAVESGDLVQVELEVDSDNNYTYLAFEDMKPAGCEPTQLRSGGEGQEGFWSYMELRDEKVAFFVGSLQQGKHLLRYRLRAEIPGTFHALPTKLFAMYVPELKANADEMLLKITDR